MLSCKRKSGHGSKALLLAAAVLSSACGTASERPSTASETDGAKTAPAPGDSVVLPASTPAGESTDGVALPDTRPISLDFLTRYSESDFAVVYTAQQLLYQDCMAERGFAYAVGPVTDSEPYHDELYPSDDLLREYGYGFKAHLITERMGDRQSSSITYPPGYEDALGQCGLQTDGPLNTVEVNSALQQIANADAELQIRVDADPRAASVNAEWVSCMSASGYDVPSTDAAIGVAQDELGGYATPEAINLSIADYSCRRQVLYSETRNEVRADLVEEWVTNNTALIEQMKALVADQVRRAKQILDAHDVSVP